MGLRILVVEDDPLIAMDTEDTLVQAGCVVIGVADRCQTAVEIAGAERPDLVVMDISLGGRRDGVEAAVLIRKQYDIPALFVSAQSGCGLAARASEAKPLGWLSKPFDKRQLLSAIEKARSKPRSRSSLAPRSRSSPARRTG
jgi:CheY-like chemotaxis protein